MKSLFAQNPVLDPGSGVPLHRQVEAWLRQMIEAPEHQEGRLLPDELTLANRLCVSRGTVRLALSRLVHDGLLERKAGVGTRVTAHPVESGISAWRSFSQEMARKGVTVSTYQYDYRDCPVSREAARRLQVPEGARVFRLTRVRGWNDQPVLQSRSWFHPRLGLSGREEFSHGLYEVIERVTGAVADTAREDFVAVRAGAVLARRLCVERTEPLLLRRHTVFDSGGRPFEHAEVHYVSSRFTLTLDLRRESP